LRQHQRRGVVLMRLYLFEASSGWAKNYGTFAVGRLGSEELRQESAYYPGSSALGQRKYDERKLWAMDMVTCEGAAFDPKADLVSQLERHQIWVCVLYEPFLRWLGQQDLRDLSILPRKVDLPDVPPALVGYRRTGPEHFHGSISGEARAFLRRLLPTTRLEIPSQVHQILGALEGGR